ncbi:MAG: polysaccharide deacetylase family protein [Gemmatimonadota bacterium]
MRSPSWALVLAVSVLGRGARPAPSARAVAVTFDDLPAISVVEQDIAAKERLTRDLLAAVLRHHVPIIGFVNENKLVDGGAIDDRRVGLLRRWLEAGSELGNHTYSHPSLNRVPLADYEADLLRGETTLRPLGSEAGHPLRYFRHPFLHTGRDLDTRRDFDQFLSAHGYRVAPVTIDNSDYVFAAAFDRARARHDLTAADSVATTYLGYMERVVAYYETQSVALLGREMRQVLLLHANQLNAATFDRLATMLERRGYSFVPLDSALADPAFASQDSYVGAGGISWLHRWALTQGKSGSFFAGEPEVPAWIERAAGLP